MKDETVRLAGDVGVIVPRGRIALGDSVEAFSRAIEDAFTGGARHILLDCTNISYADSSGIGEILGALRRTREMGGRIGLFGPRGKIHEILDIAQVTPLLLVGETEHEVLGRLKTA